MHHGRHLTGANRVVVHRPDDHWCFVDDYVRCDDVNDR